MNSEKHISYRELAGKIANIAKMVHQFHQNKQDVIAIYAHRPNDHYIALMLMQTFTLMKRSSVIVETPEQADLSLSMFKNSADTKTVLGRNPGIFVSHLYDTTRTVSPPAHIFPWQEQLQDYGG